MELDMNLGLLALLSIAGSGGVAWGSVRVALNGTRGKVTKIEKTLDEHVAADHAVQLEAVQRLTRIETKLDDLLGR